MKIPLTDVVFVDLVHKTFTCHKAGLTNSIQRVA